MNKAFQRGLLCVALAGVMGTVQATPILYTFNASGTPSASYAKLDNGGSETVTVTAQSTNGASLVTLNGNPGLGISQVQGGGSNTIDANGSRTESLLFSFDEIFSLLSFSLSGASSSESFILSWGTGAQTLGSESLIPIGSTSVSPYVVQGAASGEWFKISATRNASSSSSFYVQNLSLDHAPAAAPNALPEPSSLLLAGLALGGLATLRRRRG